MSTIPTISFVLWGFAIGGVLGYYAGRFTISRQIINPSDTATERGCQAYIDCWNEAAVAAGISARLDDYPKAKATTMIALKMAFCEMVAEQLKLPARRGAA